MYGNVYNVTMRTNIELDSEKVKKAIQITGIKTKRKLIDEALSALIKLHQRKSLIDLVGKIKFSDKYNHKTDRN